MNYLYELIFCPVHGVLRGVTFEYLSYAGVWLRHAGQYLVAWLTSRKEIVK